MSAHSNDNNVYKPKSTGFLIASFLLVLLIIAVLVSAVLLATSNTNDKEQTTASTKTDKPAVSTGEGTVAGSETSSPTGTDDTPETSVPATTDAPDTPNTPSRTPTKVSPTESTVEAASDAMHEGSLLLLNDKYTYQKDPALLISRSDMGSLTAERRLERYNFELVTGATGNYTVAGSNRFLDKDALYYFNEMTADYVKESGNKDVQVRNAYYYSGTDKESIEHATGYYLDLQIFRSTGTYPLNYETFKREYYDWFVDNCWKYGYVHVRDTGSYSTFRFVGAAHAAYMNKKGLDLEGYLAEVTQYTRNSYLQVTDGFGWEWWIYYVKALGETTEIPVIGNEVSYDISGDNLNGYIVAVNTSCFG